MAPTTFALVDAKKSILEDGFSSMDNSVVGEHVLEMQQKDFPFASEYSLEFCKLNFLNDMVSKGKYIPILTNSCSISDLYSNPSFYSLVLDFV